MVENTGNRGFLEDEVNDDGLYPIYGLAIGDNDITVGSKSGEPKLWRPDVLEEAAETLEGKDIVVNHENQDAYMKIGEVDEAKYEEGRGVLYRGAIDDDELAEKIARDWLEVSPRIKHSKEHEEIQGVKVPESIRDFDNLSVVRRGAAGSNELSLGETDELSVEELQASFGEDDDSVSEYQTIVDDDTMEELQEDIDYARWMYDDREGAEGAAVRFGCEGTHTHEVDGETWYMPCETHDKFLQGLRETDSEEVEEMQLSEARTPSYQGTETRSWGDIPADTLSHYTDNLDYDADSWGDLTQGQRNEIASHTLLGDPDADTADEGIFFPVVNASTGNLNRGALEAVRGGRGQSANIPQSTYESAFRVAGRLLNEEFDADVDEELALAVEEMSQEGKRRLAGQISSWALLTRDESLELLETLDPDRPVSKDSLIKTIKRAYDDVEEEDVREVFRLLGLGDEENMDEDNLLRIELEEVDVDKREIAGALASMWDVTTGEALSFMDALNPEEPDDRRAIATVVAREYDGLDPVDVQEILADAEEGNTEAERHKEKYSSLKKVFA